MDVRYINIEDLKSSADVKYIIIIIKMCIKGSIAVIIFYYNNVYNILYILHTYIYRHLFQFFFNINVFMKTTPPWPELIYF